MKMNEVTVTLTGAAGQIGYALLPRIASGQMFGPYTRVNLRLLEIEPALGALNGVAMELKDCAFPLLNSIICTSDPYVAMEGANWVLLVGSVPRKQGMERSDLLKINGSIFIEQGKAIAECAAKDVRVFVVGNPCNTNALIAMHHAKGIGSDRFYAMTMLDQLRGIEQLAEKAGVSVNNVKKMTIWGNHSATQYPDPYSVEINGHPASEVIQDKTWLESTFITTVQQRGAAILAARGASSAASAAHAIIEGVKRLITDTPKDDSFSMVLCSNGEYGVDKGLMFSFPCRVVDGIVQVIEGIEWNAFSREKINTTLNELREEKKAVQALGLIEA